MVAERITTPPSSSGTLHEYGLSSQKLIHLPNWLNAEYLDYSELHSRTRSIEDTKKNIPVISGKDTAVATDSPTVIPTGISISEPETELTKRRKQLFGNNTYELNPDQVNLHTHLEGRIFLQTIIGIADKYGVGFAPETIRHFERIMYTTPREKNLVNFFKKLSTRPLRLLISKLILSDNKGKNDVTACVKEIYETVYQQAKQFEDLKVMALLFCPRNLAADGDLRPQRIEQILQNSLTREERKTYNLLIKNQLLVQEKGLTLLEYVKQVGLTRLKAKENGIKTYFVVSLRRDFDYDFLTKPELYEPTLKELQHYFKNEMFDYIDICGLEQEKITEFAPFLRRLSELHIKYTIHSGETGQKNWEIGDSNMRWASQGDGIGKPALTTHNINVLNRRNTSTLDQLSKNGTILVHAISSNVASGQVNSAKTHPVLVEGLDLLSQQLDYSWDIGMLANLLLAFATDDDVVTSKLGKNHMGNEIDLIFTIVEALSKKSKHGIMSGYTFIYLLKGMINRAIKQMDRELKIARDQIIEEHILERQSIIQFPGRVG